MDARLYRLGIALCAKRPARLSEWTGRPPKPALCAKIESLLSEQRAHGGAIALFDEGGVSCAAFGRARMLSDKQATPDTYFRVASVSKFVTAYGALLLEKEGLLDLKQDVSEYLGFPIRNPAYPDEKITPAMLMTHTASLRDGKTYTAALENGAPLDEVLKGDSFTPYAPGNAWEYSNLGAGIVGCAMERAAGEPFDRLMRRLVFEPAKAEASYYPQRVLGTLADAWRLFPPSRTPNFDAARRQARPCPDDKPDPRRDYLLAHGSLCVTAPALAQIARMAAADSPIFERMRTTVIPFGERDSTLTQGIGTFVYRAPQFSAPLYGHQGLAYGAVHGLFMDEKGRGFILLTSAVSERREGVLTALNRQLCALLFPWEEPWKK